MKVNIKAKIQKRNFARFTFDLFQVSKIKAYFVEYAFIIFIRFNVYTYKILFRISLKVRLICNPNVYPIIFVKIALKC